MQRISSNVIQLYDQYYCPTGVAVSAMITVEKRILVMAYVFEPSVTLHILHQNNCHNFFVVSRISKHLMSLSDLMLSKSVYQTTILRTIFIDTSTLIPTADVVRPLLQMATTVWDTDAPVFTGENLPQQLVASLNTFENFYKPEDIQELDLSEEWEITDTLLAGVVGHPVWMKPWLSVLSAKSDITFYINHVPDATFTCHNATCAGMSNIKLSCYHGHNICAKCLDCYVQAYCLALTECIERPDLLTLPCPSFPPMTCPMQGCVQHINTDILMTLTKNKKQVTTIKSLQQTFSKYFCK
jgi:hypothetical protein